jgi:hypothetical protein
VYKYQKSRQHSLKRPTSRLTKQPNPAGGEILCVKRDLSFVYLSLKRNSPGLLLALLFGPDNGVAVFLRYVGLSVKYTAFIIWTVFRVVSL